MSSTLTTRAAWYEKNGEARDVMLLGSLPLKAPGAGEVCVRLAASGVNPSDVKSRRAKPLTDPWVVPHSDGAGTIEAVGEGVSNQRVGERVWIWNAQWQRPHGTASEFIVLPAVQAVKLPDNTDFAAGACMGIPGLTAVQAVHLAGNESLRGKKVLVTGASSAVGHYITQMVTQYGGQVIGTVGSEQKAAHAKAAGAVETIFYKTEPVIERLKAFSGGIAVGYPRWPSAAWTIDWIWLQCGGRYSSDLSPPVIQLPWFEIFLGLRLVAGRQNLVCQSHKRIAGSRATSAHHWRSLFVGSNCECP
jgi:NADPH2:quinone reductase